MITPEKLLTVNDLASCLSVRKSTVYSLVESGKIPHYRIGHQIRFSPSEISLWLETRKRNQIDAPRERRSNAGPVRGYSGDVDALVERAIAETKGSRYNSSDGKPDSIKGLKRKEVPHGSL